MREWKLPVAVNIVTGALGVGKTTAIKNLLAQKPADERWALLINEFGQLGIDAALVEAEAGGTGSSSTATGSGSSSGLVVRELAGGCLCCTLSGPLGVAIAQLAKPHRLIIEPSGLGHPAGLLDTLYSEHLRTALAVLAVVCLVDVRAAAEAQADGGGFAGALADETVQDQINVADVLVGHKADLADAAATEAFWHWAEGLYPPKAQVLLASNGQIDPAVLDLPRAPVFRPLFNPRAHSSRRAAQLLGPGRLAAVAAAGDGNGGAGDSAAAAALNRLRLADAGLQADEPSAASPAPDPPLVLAPRRPTRFPSTSPQPAGADAGSSSQGRGLDEGEDAHRGPGPGSASCGWLFCADDVFDRARLVGVLDEIWRSPATVRLKGIFRVGKSSYVVPYRTTGGDVELRPMSYRRESRLEVIVELGRRLFRGVEPGEQQADRQAELHVGAGPSSSVTGRLGTGVVAAAPQVGKAPGGACSDAGPESGSRAAGALAEALAYGDWDTVEQALLEALQG
ncbi:hypothetical protein HYH03_015502 [Edaphochlamys debaryana]|uniref:CobW C-terminal domain-containing protein n=1 Tax=Edaphochlamys debaryana TaxID=47281 RepID=A0A835XL12_9CHLO|nr:hypothetical protein HYH03_015502 [Edaphochlamys debaryana]|eukprot:KAG2485791.1 hypothetical protein HYH03_015502 [Edaphochlamys debaryana]